MLLFKKASLFYILLVFFPLSLSLMDVCYKSTGTREIIFRCRVSTKVQTQAAAQGLFINWDWNLTVRQKEYSKKGCELGRQSVSHSWGLPVTSSFRGSCHNSLPDPPESTFQNQEGLGSWLHHSATFPSFGNGS